MTRFRTPWHRMLRPRPRPHGGLRHEDHLTGERLPESSHVPRGLR